MTKILVIDDDPSIRKYCAAILGGEGVQCHEAEDGKEALALLSENAYDLTLLDLDIPHLPGSEVLRIVRSVSVDKNMRVIIISGGPSPDEMAQLMLNGADDYLTKPFSVAQLRARVKASLRLKAALDQSESLNGHMQKLIRDLERSLYDRDSDLLSVRNGLVLGLASIAGHRTTETEGHLQRLQHYCRILGEKAAELPDFKDQIDEAFIGNLEVCGPLHDIGVVALPDHILVKPGKLTPEERVIMESHTLIGAEILGKVVERYGSSMLFLQTAVELARNHHERFDGKGYPDQLVGDAIPLSARILAVGDVYDALRSRRPYRPALSHSSAVQVILQTSEGQFDPRLLALFRANALEFDRIFKKNAD